MPSAVVHDSTSDSGIRTPVVGDRRVGARELGHRRRETLPVRRVVDGLVVPLVDGVDVSPFASPVESDRAAAADAELLEVVVAGLRRSTRSLNFEMPAFDESMSTPASVYV